MIKNLQKKERYEIFSLFVNKNKLRFNEIEKQIKVRSNILAYHLDQMINDGLLIKIENEYQLTIDSEKYIPIFRHILNNSHTPLPVVLIVLLNNENQILLLKRNIRPYKNYWGLIGGKIKFEENYKDASIRLIKQKTNINGNFLSVNNISNEKVMFNDNVKHSFILFMTKMQTSTNEFIDSRYGELKWFNLDELNENEIIPSDLWLIKNKLNEKININDFEMNENDGNINNFKIN